MPFLMHHGILGQQWGKRNGPPYPLKGGSYSETEKKKIFKARRKSPNSIYNKKHFDETLKKGTVLSTLSYDKNRTKDADMFYAAHKTLDKHQYNAAFNKKIPQPIYDENGNNIGTGNFYKFRINNIATSDIKVASEDSGIKAFEELYKRDRDFYNFVTDPERMQSHFVDSKYHFKGYRQSRKALNKIRESDDIKESDVATLYRMFNYVIPSDAGGNQRMAKDVAKQRAKLFAELKKAGYGALLDTNDAIYGGFKATSPVIVFDTSNIALKNAERVTTGSKQFSILVLAGRKAIGV